MKPISLCMLTKWNLSENLKKKKPETKQNLSDLFFKGPSTKEWVNTWWSSHTEEYWASVKTK